MSIVDQALFGSIELLVWVIGLAIFAVAIEPAWTMFDEAMYDLTKNNQQAQTTWNTASTTYDTLNEIEDKRSLLHKLTILGIVPVAPIGLICRRIWKAATTDE